MKKGRNHIIIVLTAVLTFGSLAVVAGKFHHEKFRHKIHENGAHSFCAFDEDNEGFQKSPTEEQR